MKTVLSVVYYAEITAAKLSMVKGQ